MKPTLKSINAHLPSITYFRNRYILHGFAGVIPSGVEYLGLVVANYGPDGNVTEISDYATGEAKREDHYYMTDCVDITDIIAEWMKDYEPDRHYYVKEIQRVINEDIENSRKQG